MAEDMCRSKNTVNGGASPGVLFPVGGLFGSTQISNMSPHYAGGRRQWTTRPRRRNQRRFSCGAVSRPTGLPGPALHISPPVVAELGRWWGPGVCVWGGA
jgi:hypothetical protein